MFLDESTMISDRLALLEIFRLAEGAGSKPFQLSAERGEVFHAHARMKDRCEYWARIARRKRPCPCLMMRLATDSSCLFLSKVIALM